jgi:hypothetical protein
MHRLLADADSVWTLYQLPQADFPPALPLMPYSIAPNLMNVFLELNDELLQYLVCR